MNRHQFCEDCGDRLGVWEVFDGRKGRLILICGFCYGERVLGPDGVKWVGPHRARTASDGGRAP